MSATIPIEVTLYERPGCHLCEQAADALAPLVERLGARLVRVNVEADPALEARLGFAIPVVAVSSVEVASAPIDVAAVRAAIEAAAAQGPSTGAN